MPLNANKVKFTGSGNKPKQPILEAGVYPARLVQVIDYGLQPQRPYKGQEKAPAYQIGLTYELVDSFMLDEDGNELEDKPRWISEIINLFSLSSEKAKSTHRYLAMDPTQQFGGDFSQLLNTPVNVSLVVDVGDDKIERNRIGSIAAMRPRDADRCTELKNETKLFSLDDPNMGVFNTLPDWVKEKICSNLEFRGSALEVLLGGKPEVEEKAVKKAKPRKAIEVHDKQDAAVDWDEQDEEDAPY